MKRSREYRRDATNEARRQVLVEEETAESPRDRGDPAFAIRRIGKHREDIGCRERREIGHDLLYEPVPPPVSE